MNYIYLTLALLVTAMVMYLIYHSTNKVIRTFMEGDTHGRTSEEE